MALWDIRIDDVPVRSSSGNWAFDSFPNAHVVPVRKDFVSTSPLAPGATVLLGPYDVFTFSLGGWVEADTDVAAEWALIEVLSFFGSEDGTPARFSWAGAPDPNDPTDTGARESDVRVLASTIDRSDSGRGYRFKVVLENLWGAWHSPWKQTPDTPVGSPCSVQSGRWPTYRAEVTINGPVTSPTLYCGDAPPVRYNGTVAAGEKLMLYSFRPRVDLYNTSGVHKSVLSDCSYTARWAYLFDLTPYVPGTVGWDVVRVSGTDTTSASTWFAKYRALRL